jgi:hypothetical protein
MLVAHISKSAAIWALTKTFRNTALILAGASGVPTGIFGQREAEVFQDFKCQYNNASDLPKVELDSILTIDWRAFELWQPS